MSQSDKITKYFGRVVTDILTSSGDLLFNALGDLNMGTDTTTENVNLGTGAVARVVTIGNTTGATSLVLSSGTGGIALPTSSVTQLTSITTGVTLSNTSGIITTVSATTAAASASIFTVTNTLVTSASRITVNINDYAGTFATNGLPVVCVDNITSGSFDIVITNMHASNALSGILKIAFVVWK